MVFRILCCVLLLFPCLSSFATGSIHIFPAILDMKAQQTKTSFKVDNNGKDPMTFQLKAVKWEQKNGEDIYTDTKDIILNPPVVTIEPGSYQVIRLGLRAPMDPLTEHPYRIYLKQVKSTVQLPESKQNKNQLTASIQSLIEFRLPLFISPKEDHNELNIGLSTASDGKVQVTVQNLGNQHIRFSDLYVYPDLAQAQSEDPNEPLFSEHMIGYLHPNNTRTFTLAWKKPTDMKEFVVKLKTDWGNLFETSKQSS